MEGEGKGEDEAAVMARDHSLTSENTIPSSPTSDKVFSSDDPPRASSPPSSPPGFPWEHQSISKYEVKTPQKPTKSVFSLLGKRKAFEPVGNNARPAKKPISASSKPLTQMQISLGQEVQKKCKTCGMEYVASSSEDQRLHQKYHKQNTEGYDVGKDFVQKARNGTVSEGVKPGDAICAVDCFDKPARRKRGQVVMEVVQRELGAVEIPDKDVWEVGSDGLNELSELPRYRAYLYLRGTKCIGFLLVEKINEAHRVVEPSSQAEQSTLTGSEGHKDMTGALAALKARQRAAVERDKQPIELSKETISVRLGISRIWTSPTHRHQNIATALLDTAHDQCNRCTGGSNSAQPDLRAVHDMRDVSGKTQAQISASIPLPEMIESKDVVAFSQPTEAGTRLARSWFGKTYGWAVYVD